MSFFEDASLVLIPSAQKTSKVYSVKPTDGTGDLTFSRSNDTATRVGPDGLIEKVRTNLQTYSQDFSNAVWNKSAGATLTHSQTDPNGGTTASRLQMPSGTSNFLGASAMSGLTNGGKYTHSIYMKSNTGSTQSVRLIDGVRGAAGGTLLASVTTSWQRFEVVITTASTSAGLQIDNVAGTYNNDILIAFAQTEDSDFGATDYIATTSAAVSVGPVANVPRLDYLNSSCPRLLLEGQRTNTITFSEDVTSCLTSQVGTTVTANATASPDGYQSADLVAFTPSSYRLRNQTVAAATTYTMSVFFKNNTFSGTEFIAFNMSDGVIGGMQAQIQPANGTATFSGSAGAWTGVSGKVENYGNGWYRVSVTGTSVSGGSGWYEVASILPTKSAYFWGFSLEIGAYATSYIPTLGAAVTRGADAASKNPANAFSGTNAGTIFVEFDSVGFDPSQGNYVFDFAAGADTTNRILVYFSPSDNTLRLFYATTAGVTAQQTAAVTMSAIKKIAVKWDASSIKMFYNGTATNSFAFGATAPNDLTLFARYTDTELLAAKSAQLLTFPTTLTDAQCIELTTL